MAEEVRVRFNRSVEPWYSCISEIFSILWTGFL